MFLIRCLLLDDEPIARQVLRTYAERLPFLHIEGECIDALEAYNFLRQNQVELILCDIKMPQISGLDFLKALPQRPLVILITAYEQYALEAFDLDAVDYLLKPVAFDRFWRALEKVKDRLSMQQLQKAFDPPSLVNKSTMVEEAFITVKENGSIIKINLSSIHYVEAMKDYVKIYALERRLISYLTMKKLLEALPPEQFTRIHKSYIVRNGNILSLQGNMLELKSNVQLPVGFQFREHVLRVLHEYMVKR